MVRKGKLREMKYTIKFDPDIVRQRFEGLKDISIEQEKQHFANLSALEDMIKKQVLEPKGLTTLEIKNYLLFVRSLYGLTQKISSGFRSETLRNQELAKRFYFVAMGLNDDILKEITKKFGIEPKPLSTISVKVNIFKGLMPTVENFIISPQNLDKTTDENPDTSTTIAKVGTETARITYSFPRKFVFGVTIKYRYRSLYSGKRITLYMVGLSEGGEIWRDEGVQTNATEFVGEDDRRKEIMEYLDGFALEIVSETEGEFILFEVQEVQP